MDPHLDRRLCAMFPGARLWWAQPGRAFAFLTNAPLLGIQAAGEWPEFLQSGGRYGEVPGGLLGLNPPEKWVLEALSALHLPCAQKHSTFAANDESLALRMRSMHLRALRRVGMTPLPPKQLGADFQSIALLILNAYRVFQTPSLSDALRIEHAERLLVQMEKLLDAPTCDEAPGVRDYLIAAGACIHKL